ncbi:MAG: hypothetical protein M9894_23945 [Planctomycetes bacterium]|nr:hypothetical protein [Planctomycetota bacterium]
MEGAADGFALDVGALVVGEQGLRMVSARGARLELAALEDEAKLVALAV